MRSLAIASIAILTSFGGCSAPDSSRLAQTVEGLELRVTQLEGRVAQLESGSAGAAPSGTIGADAADSAVAGAPPTGAPSAVPATAPAGWGSVYLKALVAEAQLRLAVNDQVVATYSQPANVYLDAFLRRGTTNKVTFSFSQPGAGNSVELQTQGVDDDRWNIVYNFSPKAGEMESSFDLPFAGKDE